MVKNERGEENMNYLTGLLGVVAIAAPFLFGYSADIVALWTSLIIGGVLLATSIFEGVSRSEERWEYWVLGVAGILAIVSPFLFGFSAITAAVWTLIIVGAIAVIAAWSKLYPPRPRYR